MMQLFWIALKLHVSVDMVSFLYWTLWYPAIFFALALKCKTSQLNFHIMCMQKQKSLWWVQVSISSELQSKFAMQTKSDFNFNAFFIERSLETRKSLLLSCFVWNVEIDQTHAGNHFSCFPHESDIFSSACKHRAKKSELFSDSTLGCFVI